MAAVTICSDFGAQKIKSATVSTVSPSICHEVMGPDAMIFVFCVVSFKLVFFTLMFHFHQEALQFLMSFCHKVGVICIPEVIAISPGSLNSSIDLDYIMRNARLDEAQAGIKIVGEISITSDMQMTPPIWQKAKRN